MTERCRFRVVEVCEMSLQRLWSLCGLSPACFGTKAITGKLGGHKELGGWMGRDWGHRPDLFRQTLRMKAAFIPIALCGALSASQVQANALSDDLGIKAFAELNEFGALSSSLSGKLVVFVKQPDVDANVLRGTWMLIADDGKLVPLTDAGELDLFTGFDIPVGSAGLWSIAAPIWSTDERAIYFLKRVNGRTSIWLKSLGSDAAIRIGPEDLEVLNYWKRSSDGAVMFQTRKLRPELDELGKREMREGALYDERFLPAYRSYPKNPDTDQNYETQTWRINEDADHSITLESVTQARVKASSGAANSNRMWLLEWTPDSGGDEGRVSLKATDKDGQLKTWTEETDPKSEFVSNPTQVYVQSNDGKLAKACGERVCTGFIRALWWSDRLNAAVFMTRVGWGLSDTIISAWSPERGLLFSSAPTGNDIGPCSLSGTRLYCVETSQKDPGMISLYDLRSGRRSIEASANPASATSGYMTGEKIEWRSPAGEEMFGYLVSPQNAVSPPPVVIIQYIARGFLRGVGGEVAVQDLVDRGVAVFAVNGLPFPKRAYRKKAGSPPDEFEYRGHDLSAYLAGISLLERRGKIDPRRVGIWGLSHGAGVAQLGLQLGMPFAAASITGCSDSHPAYYYMVGPAEQKRLRDRNLAPSDLLDPENPISPVNMVGRIKAPILINVADRELNFTADYYATVADAGLPIEMHVYPNEWHQKWQPAHLMSAYRRNRDWFSFWLQGTRPGNDTTQYQRWDLLKAKRPPVSETGKGIWAKALADFEALKTRDRQRRANRAKSEQ